MSLLPISLSVRRAPDAQGAVLKDRLPNRQETEKALYRDAFTCRCCGFVSKKFQRVLPMSILSGRSESDDSFATVCTSCEMCFQLDRAGLTGAGILIWLPELSQAELNHVMRALYVARVSNVETLSAAAKRTLEVLIARRAEAKKRLGTDDPLILATAFHEAVDDTTYAARVAKLEGIRLMTLDRYLARQRGVDTDVFPQMIAYWTSPEGPFAQKPVSEWTGLFESVSGRVQDEAKLQG